MLFLYVVVDDDVKGDDFDDDDRYGNVDGDAGLQIVPFAGYWR